MLELLVVILILSWAMGGGLGFAGYGGYHGGFAWGGGGIIHLLLALAVIVIVMRLAGVRL